MKLVIGNKNYSSWSLRAWLYIKHSGIQFEEKVIPLHTPQWDQEIYTFSPTGRVPVLIDGDQTVWDSWAIMEHLMERSAAALRWPEGQQERALARSICAEMHAGFTSIRTELPLNIKRTNRRPALSPQTTREIQRVLSIWRHCIETHFGTGPYLFGPYTVADVMYAPVALRFVSYQIEVGPQAASYIAALRADPPLRQWESEARAEPWSIPRFDRVGEPGAGD